MSEQIKIEDPINNVDSYDDLREVLPDYHMMIRQRMKSVCSRKFVKKRLPILQWLPKYEKNFLLDDFVAGLSVCLTAIPQGIAYAVVAGLEPQYGLYAGFMGCFVYFIFGSCKDITIGPTAIMALMIQSHVSDLNPDFAVLAAFISGCAILLCGLLNLGFLVQFISNPVVDGFTTAAAITIGCGQLKSLFGVPGKSNEFLESWIKLFENIKDIRIWDTVLGVVSIIVLLLLRKLKDVKINRIRYLTKYLSLSRNALIVISGTLIAYLFSLSDYQPFILTGEVSAGLPPIDFPPFETSTGNVTYTFTEMLSELGSSIVTIPGIAILESIAIAKAFSRGRPIDATQEMIALGLCNIFGSFVRSMPVTGSFTRTAVNNASGVKTTAGGLVTGALIILALAVLTQTFFYIPKATLASVIITAMLFMTKFDSAVQIWNTKKIDLIPFVVTLLSCLFAGLEYGILIGIGVNLLIMLYTSSRPNILFEFFKTSKYVAVMVSVDQNILFSSAEYFRIKVMKKIVNLIENEELKFDLVILNGNSVIDIDITVIRIISSLIDDITKTGKKVILWNWSTGTKNAIIRFNREYSSMFKASESVDEFISQLELAGD